VRDVVINGRVTIPGSELSIAFARSGGPGGQNVNKVSSKVDLRWHPASSTVLGDEDRALVLAKLKNRLSSEGELIITSTKTRDQIQNRQDALDKLALIVRASLDRPKPRKATKVSKGAKRRRVADKRANSEKKAARRATND
jgi:ribosome-associated protein